MNLETFIDRMLLLDGSEKTIVVVAIYNIRGELQDVQRVDGIRNGFDRNGKTIAIINTTLKDGKLSAGSGDQEND
jgi:hypothetical protein